MKRPRQAEDEDVPDKPESSRRRDVDIENRSDESMDRAGAPISQPGHKIFLSHSGA